MTGKVAIQAAGAKLKPTKPLMAIKVMLFVMNRPCAIERSAM
jgi:hypothetical protein